MEGMIEMTQQQWVEKGYKCKTAYIFFAGIVLNGSKLAAIHPGGGKAVKSYYFKDITQTFFRVYPHQLKAVQILKKYQIGIVKTKFVTLIQVFANQSSLTWSQRSNQQKKKNNKRIVTFQDEQNIQRSLTLNEDPKNPKSLIINKTPFAKFCEEIQQGKISIHIRNIFKQAAKQDFYSASKGIFLCEKYVT